MLQALQSATYLKRMAGPPVTVNPTPPAMTTIHLQSLFCSARCMI